MIQNSDANWTYHDAVLPVEGIILEQSLDSGGSQRGSGVTTVGFGGMVS
jgi:hypothetical protein